MCFLNKKTLINTICAFDASNMHMQYINFEFGEGLVKKSIRQINCASSALGNCTVRIK